MFRHRSYQNKQIAEITRQTIKILLKHNKKIRILTRGLLWQKDLDILVNPNITLGMSIHCINDELLKKIEPRAPLSSDRYKALEKAYQANCRLYVAMAPTPPMRERVTFATSINTQNKWGKGFELLLA
ncbi:radical SAM protein, partial [Microcoleus sp. Pol7_A1]|uniref:radical SAM protein n=1 Tax=Microcoleus sp. Pol7_A1 TaxID=2818893 RepID=UPI002FD1AFB2